MHYADLSRIKSQLSPSPCEGLSTLIIITSTLNTSSPVPTLCQPLHDQEEMLEADCATRVYLQSIRKSGSSKQAVLGYPSSQAALEKSMYNLK